MRNVRRLSILISAAALLGIFGFEAAADAVLVSGWGADPGAQNGTVTDTTSSLGAGTFTTMAPTSNPTVGLAPRADLPSALTLTNVGDQIVFSGQVRMATVINGNQQFRFGVLSGPAGDLGTLSGGVWTGSTPTGWLGYLVEIGNLGAGNGATDIDDHQSGNTSGWYSTAANANVFLSTANHTVDNAADSYTFNLILQLASGGGVDVSYSFVGTNTSGGNPVVNFSGSAVDTTPLTDSFDAVGFLETTSSGGNATYSDVTVNYAPVPEPGSMTVLGFLSLGLIGRRRRNSCV